MKRLILILGCILFALVLMLPLVGIVSSVSGHVLEMMIPKNIYPWLTALLALTVTVLCIKEKYVCDHPVIGVFFALLAPIAPIHGLYCCFIGDLAWGFLAGAITLGCSIYLTIKQGKTCIMKTLSLFLFGLQALPCLFFGVMLLFLGLLFGDFSEETVVQRIDSPNGTYFAEVVTNDQGALGWDQSVCVYETETLPLFPFRLYKRPQVIDLYGDDARGSIDIRWKNEECLIINEKEYKIGRSEDYVRAPVILSEKELVLA